MGRRSPFIHIQFKYLHFLSPLPSPLSIPPSSLSTASHHIRPRYLPSFSPLLAHLPYPTQSSPAQLDPPQDQVEARVQNVYTNPHTLISVKSPRNSIEPNPNHARTCRNMQSIPLPYQSGNLKLSNLQTKNRDQNRTEKNIEQNQASNQTNPKRRQPSVKSISHPSKPYANAMQHHENKTNSTSTFLHLLTEANQQHLPNQPRNLYPNLLNPSTPSVGTSTHFNPGTPSPRLLSTKLLHSPTTSAHSASALPAYFALASLTFPPSSFGSLGAIS